MVSVSTAFASSVQVGQDKLVDGKSILSLMMLAASKGTVLNVIIEGDDEHAALDAITALVNNRFDESE